MAESLAGIESASLVLQRHSLSQRSYHTVDEDDYDPYERVASDHQPDSIPMVTLHGTSSDDGSGTAKPVSNTATWQIHWRAPALMFGYLLVGVGFALGHHLYWMSLDGTPVPSETDQQWAQRLGVALAFLTQSLLCLSVGVAYTQRVWVTVKKNAMTLRSLDRLFSLQEDIFAFFDYAIIGRAKVLSVIALCAWSVSCVPGSHVLAYRHG